MKFTEWPKYDLLCLRSLGEALLVTLLRFTTIYLVRAAAFQNAITWIKREPKGYR